MEISDLNLSNHADISILHKILKTASRQKLNFSSIQLALKNLVKCNEISSFDKYLNFFMLIKSSMKDDSSLNWNQIFHIYIRKLERQVLASVVYHTNLMKRSFVKWREQLSMKIIQNYVVTQQPKKAEELIDPDIKLKAKVFHCWIMYCNSKTEKREKKQGLDNQITRIGKQYQVNRFKICLKKWKQKMDYNKEMQQTRDQLFQILQAARKNKVIVFLKENIQRKEIINALQDKIKGCIVRVQKQSLFLKLRKNVSQISKPNKLYSYYGILFIKCLLEKTFNDRKQIQYSNFHSLLKFKSKRRKEIYKQQMEAFYSILKERSFKSWKIMIDKRNTQIRCVRQLILKNIVRFFKHELQEAKVINSKNKLLLKLILKRNIKILKTQSHEFYSSKQQFTLLVKCVEPKIVSIIRQINLRKIVQTLRNSKQQSRCKIQVCHFISQSKLFYAFKQLKRKVQVTKIYNSVPSLYLSNILRKYFNCWLRFYKQRDTNMVGIYRFEIDYTRRHKLRSILQMKQLVNQKKLLVQKTLFTQILIKTNCFISLIKYTEIKQQCKPDGYKIQLLRKHLYFKRFTSRIGNQILKNQSKLNKYNNVLQSHIKSKVFSFLKLAVQQSHQKIIQVENEIELHEKKKIIKYLLEEKEYTQGIIRLYRIKYNSSARQLLFILNSGLRKNQNSDHRINKLQSILANKRIRQRYDRLKTYASNQGHQKYKSIQCTKMRLRNRLIKIKQTYLQLIDKRVIIYNNQTQVLKMLNKKRLIYFNNHSLNLLAVVNHNQNIDDNQRYLSTYLKRKRLNESYACFNTELKSKLLRCEILQRRKLQWKRFYKQIRNQIEISKQNDIRIQKFKSKRNMSLAGKTIKSLIRELQRRGQALDAISSIMKNKQIDILKHSMNSIFDQYRICFKLQAFQKIRKRFALQNIANNHLQKETAKLQEYKSVKHYAQTLVRQVFKGLSLSIYKSTFNDENTGTILKTLPKSNYMR